MNPKPNSTLAAALTGSTFASKPAPRFEFKTEKQPAACPAARAVNHKMSATQSVNFARSFLTGSLKRHAVNRHPGEETFRAALVPFIPHAAY